MSRGNLSRKTLLTNFQKLVDRITCTDLPVTIKEIHAFGGILREKEKLHDLDLIVLYIMNTEQAKRWEKFTENFSTYNKDDNGHSITELKEYFNPFIEQGIPLKQAVNDEKIAAELKERGIPPAWAGCFSWTEVMRGQHGDGCFFPYLEHVIRRLLTGRSVKGLQLQIQSFSDFSPNHTMLAAKNYILAWSDSESNILSNIEDRSTEQRRDFLLKEINHFLNDEIPLRKKHDKLSNGYDDVKENAIKASKEVNLKIDIENLDKVNHSTISYSNDEPIQQLSKKCEALRIQLRNYDKESIVLREIPFAIQWWKEYHNCSYYDSGSLEECVTHFLIERIHRNEVQEDELRELLKILKLPEDRIVTVKAYRYTHYKLATNLNEQLKLEKEAKLEALRRKFILAINKAIKPYYKDVVVELSFEDLRPKELYISVYKSLFDNNISEEEKEAFKKDLCQKGFQINERKWEISGTKEQLLTGSEGVKELQMLAIELTTNS